MPPPTPTWTSPARIAWSRSTVARRPEAQTLLIVSEETSFGMPARIWACREGIWPWPAWRTWPMMTCSTCSGSTCARSSAAVIAVPPSSVASTALRAPPILPMGVRAAPRMTVLGMPGSYGGSTMHVAATTEAPAATSADTVVVGVLEDERVPHDIEGGALQALVDAGEARATPRHLAVTHAGGRRWVLAGLGRRADLDGERARAVAASALGRARDLGARTLCWEVPHHAGDDVVAGLVEGTVLAAYRFTRYRSGTDVDEAAGPAELVLSDHHDRAPAVERAAVVAAAVNRARDLQNTPPNDLPPAALGERARAIAAEGPHLSAEVGGAEALRLESMGAFRAVAQGSAAEPALVVLRYEHPE